MHIGIGYGDMTASKSGMTLSERVNWTTMTVSGVFGDFFISNGQKCPSKLHYHENNTKFVSNGTSIASNLT